MTRKCLLVVLLAAAVFASLAGATRAGWGTWFVFSDLRLASVGPATLGPNYARVIVVNEGTGSAPACWIRVTIQTSTPIVRYYSLPSVPAGSGFGVDVYTGYSPIAFPGLVTQAVVDVFNQVAEVDEGDNIGYFVSPPW